MIEVKFIGGTLGGQTLKVDTLCPRFRAVVPPKPLPVGPVGELSPIGPKIYFDEYELIWRQEGPNYRTPYCRLLDN